MPSVSRREALLRTVFFAGASAVVFGQAAEAKVAQKAAQYQDKPHQGKQCSGCAHFHAPSTCDVVEGTISPNGWCKLFTQKIT